jgi:hypothetical protein
VNIFEFTQSLSGNEPVPGLSPALKALWWDAKGDWRHAHGCVEHETTAEAAWVHAYLHRVEGDLANARYWYSRAGQPPYSGALTEEWGAIARALLTDEAMH